MTTTSVIVVQDQLSHRHTHAAIILYMLALLMLLWKHIFQLSQGWNQKYSCCGGITVYNEWSQICCDGIIYSKQNDDGPSLACCTTCCPLGGTYDKLHPLAASPLSTKFSHINAVIILFRISALANFNSLLTGAKF